MLFGNEMLNGDSFNYLLFRQNYIFKFSTHIENKRSFKLLSQSPFGGTDRNYYYLYIKITADKGKLNVNMSNLSDK